MLLPKFNSNLSHTIPLGEIPLTVSFNDKDEAKAAGAKWNWEQKYWQIPATKLNNSRLHKWLPRMHTHEQPIQPDLVPATAWYSNLRDHLNKDDWSQLSKSIRAAKGHRCEICGSKGYRSDSECHELWHYDDVSKTQTLIDLISVCHACHLCHHMGLAQVEGRWEEQVAHLAFVNKMSYEEAEAMANTALFKWQERSDFEWNINIELLAKYNLLDKIIPGKRGSFSPKKNSDNKSSLKYYSWKLLEAIFGMIGLMLKIFSIFIIAIVSGGGR